MFSIFIYKFSRLPTKIKGKKGISNFRLFLSIRPKIRITNRETNADKNKIFKEPKSPTTIPMGKNILTSAPPSLPLDIKRIVYINKNEENPWIIKYGVKELLNI